MVDVSTYTRGGSAGQFVKERLETRMGEDQFITAGLVVPLPGLDLVVNVQSLTKPTGNEMHGRTVGQTAATSAGARVLNVAQDATTWRPGWLVGCCNFRKGPS